VRRGRSSLSGKGIKRDPTRRAGRQNRKAAEILRVGSEVTVPFLRVFGEDVPNVAQFAAVRVVLEKVKPSLIQLPGATRDRGGVRVCSPLLLADHHPEVTDPPHGTVAQESFEGAERSLLLVRRERGGKVQSGGG